MFTKAEVAKMPVEQQEILAQIELSKTRQRQKLLEQVRGCNESWRSVFVGISMVFFGAGLFAIFYLVGQNGKLYVLYAAAGFSIVNALICIHTARINRRLDALLELLDFDRQNQNDSDISKDEKPVDAQARKPVEEE